MTAFLENFSIALPEIVILVTTCIVLLSNLFMGHRFPNLAFLLTTVGLALAATISFLFLGEYKTTAFSGLFISDDVAQLMKLFIYLCTFLSFFYAKDYIIERKIPVGDYYVLGLFSLLGMMVLVSAHSLLTIYLGLELLSLPLYAMTAIRRKDGNGAEAAMKYFVMGAMASGLLLYGLSLLYGATGKLDLLDITNSITANLQGQTPLISFALVFIIAGIGFKAAAMPFHLWAPDVYQGAPTSVTLFLSAGPKIAAIGMAFRLLTLGLINMAPQWQQLLIAMVILSTGAGNLLAIVQSNIKRLFAYSAIANVGYALFGLTAANPAGYAASLYYVIIYALMSVATFGLLVILSHKGLEVDKIEDLKGLNQRNPWIASMMLIVMFSMAGIPPTVGFFTKFLVLKALVDVQLTWLATLGLLFAVIGAFYYLRIVKVMYFDEAKDVTPFYFTKPIKTVFSVNCLALLFFGIFPSSLITACINAFAP